MCVVVVADQAGPDLIPISVPPLLEIRRGERERGERGERVSRGSEKRREGGRERVTGEREGEIQYVYSEQLTQQFCRIEHRLSPEEWHGLAPDLQLVGHVPHGGHTACTGTHFI